jgi:circadian clock protein KaiB
MKAGLAREMKANRVRPARPKVAPAPYKAASSRYVLKLYVAGQSPRSVSAIANIKKLCEAKLHGRYVLDVIDLYQQPHMAQGEQIIAVPTLIRTSPSPSRRVIGDLSNTERVLAGLDIRSAA